MTFTQIKADIYRRAGLPSAPVTATSTRIEAFINDTLQEVLSEPGVGEYVTLNVPPVTFASVANQAVYGLPASLQRIDAITERTNNRILTMRTLEWYRRQEPNPTTTTGTPEAWIPMGFQAVNVQPSAATGLWAVSTNAGDTTQTVRVETVRTGGYPFSGSLSLNGTTRVQLGTATDHEQITKFYISAVGVGRIDIYDAAAAGNLLGSIAIGFTFARYQGIALWPTPASAITYYVDGEHDLADMSQTTDEPPLPPRFHRLLVDGALWREFVKTDDSRAAEYKSHYYRGISQLKYFVTCPPDFLPSKRGERIARSRFGGYFPATRY